MPSFVVVTPDRHGARRWRKPDRFGFAAGDSLISASGAELSSLAAMAPLTLIERASRFELAAILSPTPGKNMFVGPDGRWLTRYVPAFYRAYPFRVLSRDGAEPGVLCVDEASDLVGDEGAGGEAFFEADGEVSPALKAIVELAAEWERNLEAARRAASALAEAGVVRPWPITVNTQAGERAIGGLWRIDEAALNALDDAAFLRLRAASALPVAYAQMLSMGRLDVFEQLAEVEARQAPPPVAPPPESLHGLFALSTGDVIRFE